MDLGNVIEAAKALQYVFESEGGSFCFIGGVAVQRWGEPRFTKDADATLITDFVEDERWVDLLLSRFPGRHPEARDLALQRRVLLLRAPNGVALDVALGALDFEKRSISRSSPWSLPDGSSIRTCSAEDLVVHKAFASRDLDWLDVERILMRQGRRLDMAVILDELKPLAELKEDPEILVRLKSLMRKRDVPAPD